jgi:Tat protein translocase TatC
MLLFAAGAAFGFFVLIPVALEFLVRLSSPRFMEPIITVQGYLHLFFLLTIALGLVFELPLVMSFLARIGVMSKTGFARRRKLAIVLAFVMAALLTPPDPLTQLLVASPIVILYEAGIWLAALSERKGGGV